MTIIPDSWAPWKSRLLYLQHTAVPQTPTAPFYCPQLRALPVTWFGRGKRLILRVKGPGIEALRQKKNWRPFSYQSWMTKRKFSSLEGYYRKGWNFLEQNRLKTLDKITESENKIIITYLRNLYRNKIKLKIQYSQFRTNLKPSLFTNLFSTI